MEDYLKPCVKCGKPVEIKWIASMSPDLAKLVGHQFNGKATWFIYCKRCGTVLYEHVPYPKYEMQQKVKHKLIKKWNGLERSGINKNVIR